MEQENKVKESATGAAAMGMGLVAFSSSISKPPFFCKLDAKKWAFEYANNHNANRITTKRIEVDDVINFLRPEYDQLPDFFDIDAKIKCFIESIGSMSQKINNGEKDNSI